MSTFSVWRQLFSIVTTLPPVESTRSDVAEEAWIRWYFLVKTAILGYLLAWFLHRSKDQRLCGLRQILFKFISYIVSFASKFSLLKSLYLRSRKDAICRGVTVLTSSVHFMLKQSSRPSRTVFWNSWINFSCLSSTSSITFKWLSRSVRIKGRTREIQELLSPHKIVVVSSNGLSSFSNCLHLLFVKFRHCLMFNYDSIS